MKKSLAILLSALCVLLCLTGCGKKTDTTAVSSYEQQLAESEYYGGLHHVEIQMKDLGTIQLELDGDTAPISTANFCTLAADGFYDGLTFHRIINGFMIQGGDPLGNGTGGSSNQITGEFEQNHITNGLKHTRGVISMARSSSPNSASSQFFIVHEDSDFLDGSYAAFGRVTDGMEIVDTIAVNTPVTDSNGSVAADDQPVIESITVID